MFSFSILHQLKKLILNQVKKKKKNSLPTDENCEAVAFPYLFPTSKYSYSVKGYLKLIPMKNFNQRVLNYTQMFSSEADYIFYALSVTQVAKRNSQINIALKHICTGQLTPGMLTNVSSFLSKDDAYQFISTIKGTPAYWKIFLYGVLAMVKQLGLPTFFMTLSCAGSRWNELISIIAILRGETLTDNDTNEIDIFD